MPGLVLEAPRIVETIERAAEALRQTSIDEQSVAAAVETLRRHHGVQAAYVLGSAAEGRLRPDSDIDVAVLPAARGGLSIEERLALTAARFAMLTLSMSASLQEARREVLRAYTKTST